MEYRSVFERQRYFDSWVSDDSKAVALASTNEGVDTSSPKIRVWSSGVCR